MLKKVVSSNIAREAGSEIEDPGAKGTIVDPDLAIEADEREGGLVPKAVAAAAVTLPGTIGIEAMQGADLVGDAQEAETGVAIDTVIER